MLRYFGVDLRDLFKKDHPMSPRFALNLIMHLPMGSAFQAERMGGPQYRDWDVDRFALTQIVDTLKSIQFLYLAAHIDRKKARLPKPPEPFPTPQDHKLKKNASKPGSFAHMVATAKKVTMEQKVGEHGRRWS